MMRRWRELIATIHGAAHQVVLAVTGGGSQAIAELLRVPGASRTVLEGRIPYSATALSDWLGRTSEQSCCRDTALAMATVAWRRARSLTSAPDANDSDAPVLVGLGCTATLASDRPKRGDHRCWIATHSMRETRLLALTLEKGARSRADEEQLVARLILVALAEAIGIHPTPKLALLAGEHILRERESSSPPLTRLMTGEISILWSLPNESCREAIDQPPAALLCGAFNPLHSGHIQLRRAAERHLGGSVWYELTVLNADKPPLDYLTLHERLCQLTGFPLALSNASTFAEKARLFPNTVFVIGVDTAVRVVQPRFYGNDRDKMAKALAEIRDSDCRFLVAGRQQGDSFRDLTHVSVPPEFTDLFEGLSEAEFREDISSTQLRATMGQNGQNP